MSDLQNGTFGMRITEIFHSIQGESTYAGQPCVFVRLTGCPLRCTWCDTAYAFHGGEEMSVADVLTTVKSYGCRLVEITGESLWRNPKPSSLSSHCVRRTTRC